MKFKETFLFTKSFELYLGVQSLIDSISELDPYSRNNVKNAFLDITVNASNCDSRLDFEEYNDRMLQVKSAVNKCIILLDIITHQLGIQFQKQITVLEELSMEIDEKLFKVMTVEEMNEICELALEELKREKNN